MKDLTKLSNEELISYFDKMTEYYGLDQQMDGTGELQESINRTWKPIWKAFKEEFHRRDVTDRDDCLIYL